MEHFKAEKIIPENVSNTKESAESKEITSAAEKEKGLFSKFGGKLVEWGKQAKEMPAKVSRATALILLLRAATSFAEASAADLPGARGENKSRQGIEKTDASPQFDWRRFINNVEISYGTENYIQEDSMAESISLSGDVLKLKQSDFYKNMNKEKVSETRRFFVDSISNAISNRDFFEGVAKRSESLTDTQKLYFLQWAGNNLLGTYNDDMLEDGEHVAVSDEEMFQGAKKYLENWLEKKELRQNWLKEKRMETGIDKDVEISDEERVEFEEYFANWLKEKNVVTGICANIHNFQVKTAQAMGIEAWLQTGVTGKGGEGKDGHVIMSAVVETDTGKQIVFLDYGTLIPTGTLNYQRALGIGERYTENVALFNSWVANVGETPMYVKSLAAKTMSEAAGVIDTEGRMGELTQGEYTASEGLKIEFGKETKKLEISNNILGLSYYDYKNAGNDYNSLDSLQAVRERLRSEKWGVGIESSFTVLSMNIKDLGNKTISQSGIVGQLAADYIKSFKLNKGEYERLKLNFGATISGATMYAMGNPRYLLGGSQFTGKSEGGLGARLVYVNPAQTSKIWVGMEDSFRLGVNDLENQDASIQKTAENFRLGAEVEVKEGVIANIEFVGGETEWGRKGKIKAGLESGKLSIKAEAEKRESDYERFVPSGVNFRGEIGYNTPIGEINIFCALDQEKYKDANTEKVWNAGVKYRIILWE